MLCIVESWLSTDIENNELTINNYHLVRHDRNRHGGCIVMLFSISVSLFYVLLVSCMSLTIV